MELKQKKRTLSPRDILLVIFRRKWTFLTIILLTPVLVWIGVCTLPLPHKAKGTVFVERSGTGIAHGVSVTTAMMEREEVLNTEIEILSSRTVMERVVDKLRFHENPPSANLLAKAIRSSKQKLITMGLLEDLDRRTMAIQMLMEKVRIKPAPLSNVIKISYVSDDPNHVASVVNTVIDMYLERRDELLKSVKMEGFYARQAQMFERKLETLREQERSLRARMSSSELGESGDIISQELQDLRSQLRKSQLRLVEIRESTDGLQTRSSYVPFDDKEGSYYIVDTMGSSLLELEMSKTRLEESFNADFARLRLLNQEIDQLKERIINSLNVISHMLAARVKLLTDQIRDLDNVRKNLLADEARLHEVTSAIHFAEQSYMQYLTLQERARLSQTMDASFGNVRPLDYARVPSGPVFPRIVFIALGVFTGFVVALVVVVIQAYFNHRIDSAADAEQLLSMRVYCVVPKVRIDRRHHARES